MVRNSIVKPYFPLVMDYVYLESKKSTKILVQRLQGKFPNHELMLALGVIYLNFWANHPINAKDNFHQHMTIIKYTYCICCKMGNDGMWMKPMLDGYVLDLQCLFCKMTMITNNKLIMKEKFDVNPVIWSWTKIRFSSILKHKFLKFMKQAKIACVQVFGFIEDEQCFLKKCSWKTSSDHPFGFVHSILCAMLLHVSKLPFWRGHQPMDKHKNTILCWFLNTNALVVEASRFLLTS